jgi:hypothetical protein
LSILGSTGIAGAFSAPVILGTLIDLTGAYTAAFLYAVAVTIVGGALVFPRRRITSPVSFAFLVRYGIGVVGPERDRHSAPVWNRIP